MSKVSDTAAADRKRTFLLTSLGVQRPSDQQHQGSDAVRWPESLHDRVVRLRIEVADVFKRAILEAEGSMPPADVGMSPPNISGQPLCSSLSSAAMDPSDASVHPMPNTPWQHRKLLALIEGDVLRGVQRLAEELPRGVYQESVHARMRAEFQERSHAISAQKEQLMQQQQQLYNARRLHHSHGGESSSGAAAGLDETTSHSPLSINSPVRPSSPMAGGSRRQHVTGGASIRPASAGATAGMHSDETFADAHLRHLYSQLHESKAEVQQERARVEALKAFCIRKDAAVDYIRETLLHEVVVLKEQLRRQEHDPNFVSDFVTLFDCWKVLEGDDPGGSAGGAGGASEAVRQAKKELQAEAARVQQQFQLVIRKKDEEIANLQGKLNDTTQGSSPLERKKSGKGKKQSDDFHEQFLQLTGDMAKKDVCIAELTEELKQMQTEVAIAQQLAKSTRDQLNRSNVDIESAVSIRDTEILAKCELIDTLEAENTKLRQLVSDDEVKRRQAELDGAMHEVAVVTSRAHELEQQTELLRNEAAQLRCTLQTKSEEVDRLQDICHLSSDERTAVLERRVLDLEAVVAAKDAEVKRVEYTMQNLETELDRVSSSYETVKFEHTKLRSAMRSGVGGSAAPNQEADATTDGSLRQTDAPEAIGVLQGGLEGGDDTSPGSAAPPEGAPSTLPAKETDATWALERRLAKEMATTKRLRMENEALQEDIEAMKAQLVASNNNGLLTATTSNSQTSSAPHVKSPRKRSSSKGSKGDPSATGQRSPMRSPTTPSFAHGATMPVGDASLRDALATKDRELEVLRSELDTLRQQQADAAAAAIVDKGPSVVTFAFHVSEDADAPPPAETASPPSPRRTALDRTTLQDVPNITIDALRPAHKNAAAGSGGRPTTTKKLSSSLKQQQGPPASASRSRTHGQHEDNDVSPFEATLQGCGDTIPPGAWDVLPSFGHHRDTVSASPQPSDDNIVEPNQCSMSEVPSMSDGVYHRALHGGGGEATPTEETVPTRVRLLEATLGEREAQLHAALLQIAMLNAEVQQWKANEIKQQCTVVGLSPPPLSAVTPPHAADKPSPGTPTLAAPPSSSSWADGPDGAGVGAGGVGCSTPPHIAMQPVADTSRRSVTEGVQVPDAGTHTSVLLTNPVGNDEGARSSGVPPSHTSCEEGGRFSGCSVAVQTDIAMSGMWALIAAASAASGQAGGSTKNTPPLSNAPSRQGSANHHRVSQMVSGAATGVGQGHADAGGDEEASIVVPTSNNPTHRIFSAHRRAVHAAGTPPSVHQTSGRVPTEAMFYIGGDGEVVHQGGSSGEHACMDDPTNSHGLPAGRVLRQPRPNGSATSQRGGMLGDRLNSAVAVAKGLCDSTKARSGSTQRPGSATGDDHSDLQQLMARPSSSMSGPKRGALPSSSPSVLQQVHRPQAPAVLQGLSESVQTLAKSHLTLHPLRMTPHPQQLSDATAAAMSEEQQALCDASTSQPSGLAAEVAVRNDAPPPLPNTVDCREHVSQVIFGVGEQGALRGVKEKIKQNVNVEKFLSKVLTVRR